MVRKLIRCVCGKLLSYQWLCYYVVCDCIERLNLCSLSNCYQKRFVFNLAQLALDISLGTGGTAGGLSSLHGFKIDVTNMDNVAK